MRRQSLNPMGNRSAWPFHRISLVLVLLISMPVLACLWDRDSLRAEAKGLPGVAEALAGRIDRWPLRVFEERLARVGAQIDAGSNDLNLFDDAAVACDRLGDDDAAIEWMKRKKAILDSLDATDSNVTEHEYRYFANLGTFHAHRWLRNGAGKKSADDLKTGIEFISKAMELNPQAHFGREAVQLALMEVLQYDIDHPDEADLRYKVAFWSASRSDGAKSEPAKVVTLADRELVLDEAVEGLVGLMALGAAWESVDVHAALAELLAYRGDRSLVFLCELRICELFKSGHATRLTPPNVLEEFQGEERAIGLRPWQSDAIRVYFNEARAIVDKRNADRDKFILARLDAGRHPDDESPETFWAGFVEPVLPSLPSITGETAVEQTLRYVLYVIAALAALIVVQTARRRFARRQGERNPAAV